MVRLILALVLCTSVLAQKRPPRREAQKEFAECLLTGGVRFWGGTISDAQTTLLYLDVCLDV